MLEIPSMLKYSLLLLSKNAPQRRYIAFDAQKLQWEGVVGLEVHAQINSNSKLFSGAGTKFAESVNNKVSLFDAAIPGTLPVLNWECVRKGVMTALALNCTIHETSWFDRKHYFYADLPAGYQITQQRAPFATNGCLEFQFYTNSTEDKPCLRESKIKQVQLEQDSGKSIHDHCANLSLVDLNRAGNPLMEIVFEPDLRSGDEAACLVKELILIFKKLDTCSCKIEEGALRVDANISVRPKGSQVLGVRTEVKNIGGVSNVLKAVNYEIDRQIRYRKAGKDIVNETRAWDADVNRTVVMRDKEVEQDYRFMPEPNLPPLRLSLDENDSSSKLINVPALKKQLPELPAVYRTRLLNQYQLPLVTVLRLLVKPKLMDYFIDAINENPNRDRIKFSNFLMMDVMAALYKEHLDLEECVVNAKTLGELFDLLRDRVINRVILSRVLDIIVKDDKESPTEIVEKNQWYQVNDEDILKESCQLTIEFNPEWVEEYHRSKKLLKKRSFQRIYNEALEHTHGRANLIRLKEILEKMLERGE